MENIQKLTDQIFLSVKNINHINDLFKIALVNKHIIF